MLVLSRKAGEKLLIGNVTIIVKKVRGKAVSLAIDAPPDVKVTRGELHGKEPKNGE